MKRFFALLGIFVITIFLGVLLTIGVHYNDTKQNQSAETSQNQRKLVTSFEPVYVIVSRLTEGSDYYQISNLTSEHTGCLHEYQLTTDNMKQLESADLFFVNGGGMEGFLEEVARQYDDLVICNISENLELQEEEEHAEHDAEADGHDEHDADVHEHEVLDEHEEHDEHEGHVHSHEYNAHFWMNPEQYLLQIDKAAEILVQNDPENASIYQKNAQNYKAEVDAVGHRMKEKLGTLSGAKVISFHEAFEPLAEYLGIEVLKTVDLDGEVNLSAGDIGEIVRLIQEEGVSFIWMENNTAEKFMDTVIKETGVTVIELDTLTGKPENEKNAYIDGMLSNIIALEEMTGTYGS